MHHHKDSLDSIRALHPSPSPGPHHLLLISMAPFNITQLKSMKYGLDVVSHFTQAPISLSEHYIPTMSTGAKWLPIQLHWGHLPITYGLSLEKMVDTFYNITRSSSTFSLCSSTYVLLQTPQLLQPTLQ